MAKIVEYILIYSKVVDRLLHYPPICTNKKFDTIGEEKRGCVIVIFDNTKNSKLEGIRVKIIKLKKTIR